MSTAPKLDSRTQGRAALAMTTRRVQGFGRYWLLAIFTVILIAVYAQPLYRLVRYSLGNQLYSHILMIPFVSAYLVGLKRGRLPAPSTRFSIYAAIPLVLGLFSVSLFLVLKAWGWALPAPDQLSLTTLSFVLFLIAGTAWIFGPARTRALAFPLAFLLFIAPFPGFVTHAIEMFFQHASADAASLMFGLSQTSVLRDGLFFKLPGITIEVAEECSGIRSTLVLFITSLVGSYLFFQSKTHRALLAFAIIPIAIVRNGFRIFTIAMLCVHVRPDMIHSWIHKRGGPIFFALSLIPFFALLLYLYSRERRTERKRLETQNL
jgi:exosortase C (VPDSG-CTERM-specific)